MSRKHTAFIMGMFCFMVTTYLAVMIPIVVKHDLDTMGWATYVVLIGLGYFCSFLLLYVQSQWKNTDQ